MVSLWVPLTDVVGDNGCMSVIPKEFDTLFDKPDALKHLCPYDKVGPMLESNPKFNPNPVTNN